MTIKETIPFNFDEIYAQVEKKFKDKGYDTQEGSNTMQLVTAMSYMVSMLNANTASNVNETILSLARKRTVALNDARVLGYEVEHIQSYQYDLTIEYSTPGTYRINKYDTFKSGAYTYYYFGDTTDSFEVTPGNPVTKTITVKEGILKRYDDESTLKIIIKENTNEETGDTTVNNYVDVPFTKIEDNGIEMFLTYYDKDGIFHEMEEWKKSERYMLEKDSTLDNEFVRLDIIDYGTPRLYFKIGNIGNDIRVGSLVFINALESSGTKGEMTSTPTDSTGNGTVTEYTLLVEGAEEESLESIQNNAPLFYNTATRVVTGDDYKAFCNRQTSVDMSSIWDGQDEYPTRAGYIWFSFIPSTKSRVINDDDNEGYTWSLQDPYDVTNWYIEDNEITNIFDVLDEYKIPTLRFKHRNPIYMDFEYDIDIPRYVIATSEGDINEGVFNVINEYFDKGDTTSDPVETFNYEYFSSNMLKRIDTKLTENMGCNVTLKTSINLNQKLINEEGFDGSSNKDIYVHLDVPFDGIFENDAVVFDKLPKIDTENFVDTRNLYVDPASATTIGTPPITVYDIKLSDAGQPNDPGTDDIVGKYRVYPEDRNDIEVIFYVISAGGHTVGLDETDLTIDIPQEKYGLTMLVQYDNENVPVTRNTIPRLKTVNFT